MSRITEITALIFFPRHTLSLWVTSMVKRQSRPGSNWTSWRARLVKWTMGIARTPSSTTIPIGTGRRRPLWVSTKFVVQISIQLTGEADTLFRDLTHARELFIEKHAVFQMLCILYANKLPDWNNMDRRERKMDGKEVQCVYRHSKRNGTIYHSSAWTNLTHAQYSFISNKNLRITIGRTRIRRHYRNP